MLPTSIGNDIYVEYCEGTVTLSHDMGDMSGIFQPLAKNQRPRDLAMIAIKIIQACDKVELGVTAFASEYLLKYS